MIKFPLLLFALGCFVGGCTSTTNMPSSVSLPAAGYSAAFSAARDTLISRRFDLERVDARAGVITTRPKPSSGLATPWDTEQSTLDQETEDLLNRQQRIVRITFEPVHQPSASSSPPGAAGGPADQPAVLDDLRVYQGELTARVEVVIERLHRPGWQLEPGAVRHSSYTMDPALVDRQMWPTYAVPFSQDPDLAGRIAAEIQTRIGGAETAAK